MARSTRGLSGPARPVLCVDCLHQSANAQNLHHAFHVVGQDVQRHFGADVLERFLSDVSGGLNRLTQHFILNGKDRCVR